MAHCRAWSFIVLFFLFSVTLAGCLGGSDTDQDLGPDGDDQGTNGDNGTNNGDDDPDKGSRDPGSLEGVVLDYQGPVEGARVDLSPRVFLSAETDSQGRFSFDEVPPGDYRLSVSMQYYERERLEITIGEGEAKEMEVEISLQMIRGTNVPAKYGKMVPYVQEMNPLDPDVLLASASVPVLGELLGLPETMVTNKTKNNTFPGFWDLEPEEGYYFARVDVVLMRFDVDMLLPVEPPEEPPRAELGLRYFRGESLLENELVETQSLEYHNPDPVLAIEEPLAIWFWQVKNEDWTTWGPRNWQVGVTAEDTEGQPIGAGVPHLIQIMALLVDEEYAEAIAE